MRDETTRRALLWLKICVLDTFCHEQSQDIDKIYVLVYTIL